jgi:alkylated DNA repair protein (DNA oxidative demethylase)
MSMTAHIDTPILALQFMSLFVTTQLPPGVALQRGVARDPAIVEAVNKVLGEAPLRTMVTPRGPMSVRMTNCGALGWVSDANGYRYDANDPLTGRPWPAIPATLLALAARCAADAGFPDFSPDACLVNQYLPGAQMGLHQDRDERDFTHPIVSVSLGLPARFTIGGATRKDPTFDVTVEHGDVVVFGGPARRMLHGVKKLAPGHHADLGAQRINLTFRRAG